jgi:hypothetical protein
MNRYRFLPGVGHCPRTIFFMLGVLILYCLWLVLLSWTGIVEQGMSNSLAAPLLLLPMLPVGAFDLWLRLTWEAEISIITQPPPPKLVARLLQREYGLYWFPVLICPPLWLWAIGLIGMTTFA